MLQVPGARLVAPDTAQQEADTAGRALHNRGGAMMVSRELVSAGERAHQDLGPVRCSDVTREPPTVS